MTQQKESHGDRASEAIGKSIALTLGNREELTVTFGHLWNGAAAIAAYLQDTGIEGTGTVSQCCLSDLSQKIRLYLLKNTACRLVLVNNWQDHFAIICLIAQRTLNGGWTWLYESQLHFRVCSLVPSRHGKKPVGRIINISSVVASSGNGTTKHAASKLA